MEHLTITEAAKMLKVEAHVLRYWEDELRLSIKRNRQGHRYYDERDIRLFRKVQELKEQGFQLKDVRNAIERAREMQELEKPADAKEEKPVDSREEKASDVREEKPAEVREGKASGAREEKDLGAREEKPADAKENLPVPDTMLERMEAVVNEKVVDFKQAQLQTVMNRVVANAFRENKEILMNTIKEEITADVMRQFDTVMREREEREEQRYRKLDEVLRQLQQSNLEVAATRVKKRRGFRR